MDKPNYALSERLAATAEVQDIINLVKEELFNRTIHCLDIYDAVTYRFQSTNCGTNILIKQKLITLEQEYLLRCSKTYNLKL
ncbi:uncharacterized protein LOC101235228 isoform X3 [Hydra vulgaris]|uniref:Uncharacterized protein LOC101235228 isoform X3 n=1 Tax=Hydra vulgaris TaxID=6087 RepID=A0ABM4BL84_HYDVU